MKSSVDLKPALDFLSQLEQNNNKAWFDAHRAAYEAARDAFADFVDDLIRGISAFDDLGDLSAKDCVFRINRDVRFAKDKSPYKTNMGAHIAPGGRKSGKLGYYLHIEPHDKSFVGGGLHMPMPPQLAAFRKAIARDASAFKQITRSKSFVQHFGTVSGERLSTAPQGYPRDHAEIELLQLKEVVAGQRIPDASVLSPDLAAHALKAFKALKPFLDYLNSIM